MLEHQFFPTPPAIIRRMVTSLTKTYGTETILPNHFKRIADPQAGSGAILDYLAQKFGVKKSRMYAMELNSDLRFTLNGKGYNVIGIDFLDYDEPCKFDLILSNPPFKYGAEHTLKAYEYLNDGGSYVGLLNAETIRNPYSSHRKRVLDLLATSAELQFSDLDSDELLQSLEQSGHLEWLGQCFKDSERPTDVEVVIIRLSKPSLPTTDFSGFNFELDAEVLLEGFNPDTLAHRDFIADLVCRYQATRRILLERHELQSKLDFYLKGISSPVYEAVSRDQAKSLGSTIVSTGIEEQLFVLKSSYWNTVFEKLEIAERSPTNFKNKFIRYTIDQSQMQFSVANVNEMLFMFALNMGEFMKEALVVIFDKATSHHEDNKVSEGWKTNKSWKLNKRIIVPNVVFEEYGDIKTMNSIEDFLDDLDKVLCWLSGSKFKDIDCTYLTIKNFCAEANNGGDYKQAFSSTFFKIRIYKKGTMHIDFLDLGLLEKFNRVAAEGKKWIGSENPLET